MSERREFTVQEPPVSGEIRGDESSRRVVIISHGFGVKRDGRGMFTQLAERLQETHQTVLFDYVTVDADGDTTAQPLSEQSAMLQTVIAHIRETLSPEELSVVAHSQGCLVVSLALPNGLARTVLVSPPLSAPNVSRMQEVFGSREGTTIDRNGMSTIKRSDGKLTYIPAEFWDDTEGMEPAELYKRLAEVTDLYFVRANQDQVLSNQDHSAVAESEGITYIELDGDHDFTGDDRENWLNLMVQLIKGDK